MSFELFQSLASVCRETLQTSSLTDMSLPSIVLVLVFVVQFFMFMVQLMSELILCFSSFRQARMQRRLDADAEAARRLGARLDLPAIEASNDLNRTDILPKLHTKLLPNV